MKKYRLKEEVKKYFNKNMCEMNEVDSLEEWNEFGVTLEALEEVPSRIELEISPLMDKISCVSKRDKSIIMPHEKVLMEKALNGELLDVDSLNDEHFAEWYCYHTDLDLEKEGIKEVLKQYIKEKK